MATFQNSPSADDFSQLSFQPSSKERIPGGVNPARAGTQPAHTPAALLAIAAGDDQGAARELQVFLRDALLSNDFAGIEVVREKLREQLVNKTGLTQDQSSLFAELTINSIVGRGLTGKPPATGYTYYAQWQDVEKEAQKRAEWRDWVGEDGVYRVPDHFRVLNPQHYLMNLKLVWNEFCEAGFDRSTHVENGWVIEIDKYPKLGFNAHKYYEFGKVASSVLKMSRPFIPKIYPLDEAYDEATSHAEKLDVLFEKSEQLNPSNNFDLHPEEFILAQRDNSDLTIKEVCTELVKRYESKPGNERLHPDIRHKIIEINIDLLETCELLESSIDYFLRIHRQYEQMGTFPLPKW